MVAIQSHLLQLLLHLVLLQMSGQVLWVKIVGQRLLGTGGGGDCIHGEYSELASLVNGGIAAASASAGVVFAAAAAAAAAAAIEGEAIRLLIAGRRQLRRQKNRLRVWQERVQIRIGGESKIEEARTHDHACDGRGRRGLRRSGRRCPH